MRHRAATTTTASAEHLHLVGHDLCAVAVRAVLALVFTGAQSTFDIDLRAFAQIFTGDLRQSVRRTPPATAGSQRRVRFQALDDLRVAESSINSLARRLESGEGRAETYPTFRRIRTLRNDIAMQARRAHIMEPTLSKLEAAQGLLEQLAPYYQPEETD